MACPGTKDQGRRRERQVQARWQSFLPTVRAGLAPSLWSLAPALADREAVTPEPLSRRRPLSSGTGDADCGRVALTASQHQPARVDAIIDIKVTSKTVKWRLPTSSSSASQSSSSPPSLFSSSPWCPPSQSVSGDFDTAPAGIASTELRITPEQRKNQRSRLMRGA